MGLNSSLSPSDHGAEADGRDQLEWPSQYLVPSIVSMCGARSWSFAATRSSHKRGGSRMW